jgi:aminoglycoside phosphotransferase (APT) family kinase protein
VRERIHDDEADTSEQIVRSLLLAQCGQWADGGLTYLRSAGTDNVLWRLNADGAEPLVVRLPRTSKAAKGMAKELQVLPLVSGNFPFPVPEVRHHGTSTEQFPHPWAVLNWLNGSDAWSSKGQLDDPRADDFALDIAQAIVAIRSLARSVPDLSTYLPTRVAGERGGPINAVLNNLEHWLCDPQWQASNLLDVTAVRRSAAESLEVAMSTWTPAVVHGDLLPGNILVAQNEGIDYRLAAVIDWGGAGIGDPAQDLAPAWALLETKARQTFREALEVDDETWLRARGCELEHAVGGVLYYVPRRHPLGDIMTRTLERILAEN